MERKETEKDHRWRTVSARVRNETQNPKQTDDQSIKRQTMQFMEDVRNPLVH
jgi:hypothetical protein